MVVCAVERSFANASALACSFCSDRLSSAELWVAESDAAGLTTSLQQERQRAAQLEKDLAAARRDVETQTALFTHHHQFQRPSERA